MHRRPGRAVAVLVALAALAAVALVPAACQPRARFATPAAGPAALRFPHAGPGHAGLACALCHDPADVRAGRPARPGVKDHAPCDQSGCHAREFADEPGAMCTLCHDEIAPWQPGATTLAPYPPRAPSRTVPAAFSHALHLDKPRLDAALGFHVACDDCHQRGGADDDYDLPGHAACARCHAATSKAAGGDAAGAALAARSVRPALDDCAGCHRDARAQVPRARVLITDDLHFRHANHEADRAGAAIACATCHRTIADQRRAGGRATPTTAACVACHDDERRTPVAYAMSQCSACHGQVGGARGLSLVAPRSHLPPRDRPDSHTLAFRKDHGADARRDPKACATCHTGLSGRPENCDECHQTMRPNDHLVGWAELSHGREAAIDATRCARCHAGDFCTTCHARTPRSHLPLDSFRGLGRIAGHGQPARENLRACLTCHDPERDCASAGCHTGVEIGL